MIHQFSLQTKQKEEFLDITQSVAEAVKSSKITNGICVVFSPHTTAGITVNEGADPDVARDILFALWKLAPGKADYSHTEGNSPAHIKASIIGSSITVFVKDGKLALGRWQRIFFCEFDGPRERQAWIEIVKTS